MGAPLSLSCSGVSFSRGPADPPVSLLACCLDEQLMCFVLEEYHKKKAVNHLRANLQYMLKGRLVANKAITEQVRPSLLSLGVCFHWGTRVNGNHPRIFQLRPWVKESSFSLQMPLRNFCVHWQNNLLSFKLLLIRCPLWCSLVLVKVYW